MAFDSCPIWLVFLLMAISVMIAIELGFRIGRFRQASFQDEREQVVGTMVGSTLGLLAFLLAFTFGLAATRFDARRSIVVQEANAIGTTYLRADLLPLLDESPLPEEPPRSSGSKLSNGSVRRDGSIAAAETIKRELQTYIDDRLEVIESRDVERVLSRSEQTHRVLWESATQLAHQHPDSLPVSLFIQSLNEMIDIHSERVLVGLRNRLPMVLWLLLGAITLFSMAGVGYHEGVTKSRRSLATLLMVFSFSSIGTLIVDLDRPQDGFLKVSQQPLIDLRNSIHPTQKVRQ
jgi:hypothetical protein